MKIERFPAVYFPALALTLTVLVLTGCKHSEPGIEVQTVEVPVPVPCLPKDQIPAEPATVGAQLTGNPAIDLPIVVKSALELRVWGRSMHAPLVACAG